MTNITLFPTVSQNQLGKAAYKAFCRVIECVEDAGINPLNGASRLNLYEAIQDYFDKSIAAQNVDLILQRLAEGRSRIKS